MVTQQEIRARQGIRGRAQTRQLEQVRPQAQIELTPEQQIQQRQFEEQQAFLQEEQKQLTSQIQNLEIQDKNLAEQMESIRQTIAETEKATGSRPKFSVRQLDNLSEERTSISQRLNILKTSQTQAEASLRGSALTQQLAQAQAKSIRPSSEVMIDGKGFTIRPDLQEEFITEQLKRGAQRVSIGGVKLKLISKPLTPTEKFIQEFKRQEELRKMSIGEEKKPSIKTIVKELSGFGAVTPLPLIPSEKIIRETKEFLFTKPDITSEKFREKSVLGKGVEFFKFGAFQPIIGLGQEIRKVGAEVKTDVEQGGIFFRKSEAIERDIKVPKGKEFVFVEDKPTTTQKVIGTTLGGVGTLVPETPGGVIATVGILKALSTASPVIQTIAGGVFGVMGTKESLDPTLTPEQRVAGGIIGAGGFLGLGSSTFPFIKGAFARGGKKDILGVTEFKVTTPKDTTIKADIEGARFGFKTDLPVKEIKQIELIPPGGQAKFAGERILVKPDIKVTKAIKFFAEDIPLIDKPKIPKVKSKTQELIIKSLTSEEAVSGSIAQEALVKGSRSSFGSDIDIVSPDITQTSLRLQSKIKKAGIRGVTFEPKTITDSPIGTFDIIRIKERGKVIADIDPIAIAEEGFATKFKTINVKGTQFVDPRARLAGKLTQLKRGKIGNLLDAEGKVITDIRQLTGGAIEPLQPGITGAFGKPAKFQTSFIDKKIDIGQSAISLFKRGDVEIVTTKDIFGTPVEVGGGVPIRESRLGIGKGFFESPGDVSIGFGGGGKPQAVVFLDQKLATKGQGKIIKDLAKDVDKGVSGARQKLDKILKDIFETTKGEFVPSVQARGELEVKFKAGSSVIVKGKSLGSIRIKGQAVEVISAKLRKPRDVLSLEGVEALQKASSSELGIDILKPSEKKVLLSELKKVGGRLSERTIIRESGLSRDIPITTIVSPVRLTPSLGVSSLEALRRLPKLDERATPQAFRRPIKDTRKTILTEIRRKPTPDIDRITSLIPRRTPPTTSRRTPPLIPDRQTPPTTDRRRPPTDGEFPPLLPSTPRGKGLLQRIVKKIEEPSFDVGVVKGGKPKIIRKGLNRKDALDRGAELVLRKLRATFFLKPSKQKAKDIEDTNVFMQNRDLFRRPSPKSKLNQLGSEVYVQKKRKVGGRGSRLGTFGEVSEILSIGKTKKKVKKKRRRNSKISLFDFI